MKKDGGTLTRGKAPNALILGRSVYRQTGQGYIRVGSIVPTGTLECLERVADALAPILTRYGAFMPDRSKAQREQALEDARKILREWRLDILGRALAK